MACLTPFCGRYIVKSVAAMHPSDALLTYTLRMLTTAALGKRASTKFIDAGAFDVAQALLLRVREACSVPTPSHPFVANVCVWLCVCVLCVVVGIAAKQQRHDAASAGPGLLQPYMVWGVCLFSCTSVLWSHHMYAATATLQLC